MMDCRIIRDLMPLSVEGMVSNQTQEALEEHIKECTECRKIYENMKTPEPKVTFNKEPAKSFKKYVKKKKMSLGWKIAIITAVCIIAAFVLRLVAVGGLIGFLALDSANAKIIEDNDVLNYEDYMGTNANKEYVNKWGMDESIFPKEITNDMDVLEYSMVYYNPWDSQFLSYLTVEYNDEEYKDELNRLQGCAMDEYIGYYGVTGFDEKYTLLAMEADSYQGFVYALNTGDHEITYVEIIFCNYFMDLKYWNYIRTDYLPLGFDAKKDNPYEKQICGDH